MGTTINGAGNAASRPMLTGTLTIKNINDPRARIGAVQSMQKNTQKKTKPLNYNHREISGQLIRAKKAQNAATVLTRAKSRLANLQRAAGTGQYSSKETTAAIAHARRMVRAAQLKVRNLKEEERENRTQQKESGAKRQQREGEIKRRVAAKERELKEKAALEETQEVIREKQKRTQMAQKRRIHRNEERAKINEADMKYLKAMADNSSTSAGSSYDAFSGVAFDISSAAMALAELAMMEQEQQIETEAEAEVEAEMALEAGGASGGLSGVVGGMTATDVGTEAAVGEISVDVSV